MGLVVDAIANGATGYVYPCDQIVSGVNVGAASVGDDVFLGTSGGFAFTTAPAGRVERIGIVTATGASGSIYLFPTGMQVLQAVSYLELADDSVRASNLQQPTTTNGQVNAAGLQVIRAHYDYALAGGSVGTIALLATVGGLGATPIPDNFVAILGFLNITSALTSGGSATAALQLNVANDLLSAVAYSGSPWSSTGKKSLTLLGTGATMLETTAARDISLVIGGAALTAGVFDVVLLGVEI